MNSTLSLFILVTSFFVLTSAVISYETSGSRSTRPRVIRRRSELKGVCGSPGAPQNGRVMHLMKKYEEGMVVTYECDEGFYLLGPMTRTCLANGTWSSVTPTCDQPIKSLGQASASEALNNYPASLAIDSNFQTCFFSNRRKPRWWRVELPPQQNHSILSVALTFPPINSELHFSIYVIQVEDTATVPASETNPSMPQSSRYHKCATFRGVFSSKTIVVQCAGDLKGNFLQIEDDHPSLEYFGLCEVDIMVARESYSCGEPEVPANGYIAENGNATEYFCNEGFQLVGESTRTCDSTTGKWAGEEPACERIVCPAPAPVDSGFYRLYGDFNGVAVVGSRAFYECRPGYLLGGANDTRICMANGEWSGDLPVCEAVDCGHPESLMINLEDFMASGAHFRFMNDSTKYTSIVELQCPKLLVPKGDNNIQTTTVTQNSTSGRSSVLFRCREDGIWTELMDESAGNSTEEKPNRGASSCVRQRHNGFLYYFSSAAKTNPKFRRGFRENFSLLHGLAIVVMAAFVSILLIIVFLFKKNILQVPELPPSESFKRAKDSVTSFFSDISSSAVNAIQTRIQRKPDGSNSQTNCKQPPIFTITPSASASAEENSSIDLPRNSSPTSHSSQRSLALPATVVDVDPEDCQQSSDDFNSALATFYEEITNAAKQVYISNEDNDRKMARAARIAAELDHIRSQQIAQSNYHWIYATPPRPGASSLPASLNPSLDESCNIRATPSCASSVYARVDLIRKHQHRVAGPVPMTHQQDSPSVYQVPPPQRSRIIDPNSPLVVQGPAGSVYHLRKAISSPEQVYLEMPPNSEYVTMSRSRWGEVSQQAEPVYGEYKRQPLATLL